MAEYRLVNSPGAPCDACGQPIEDGETCWLRGVWDHGVQTLSVRVHERCWHADYGRPVWPGPFPPDGMDPRAYEPRGPQ